MFRGESHTQNPDSAKTNPYALKNVWQRLLENGDKEAYKQITSYLQKVAYAYGASRNSAIDVNALVADTISKAMMKAVNFRGESQIETWLSIILRNNLNDLKRILHKENGLLEYNDSVNHAENELPSDGLSLTKIPTPEQAVSTKQELTLVFKAIATLFPQQRKILEFTIDGLSQKEIADRLGIKPSTVGSLTNTARENLRKALKKIAK